MTRLRAKRPQFKWMKLLDYNQHCGQKDQRRLTGFKSVMSQRSSRESVGKVAYFHLKHGKKGGGVVGAEAEIVVERQHKKEILCSSVAAGCSLQSK